MVLELANGQQLNVVRIFGGPRLINGVTRDTLSIEIDPSVNSIEELASIFQDPTKTNHLYTYPNEDEVKVEIGEGYNIFISTRLERRKVDVIPGRIVQEQYYDINVVNIAQLTYDEYQDFLAGTWIHPDLRD